MPPTRTVKFCFLQRDSSSSILSFQRAKCLCVCVGTSLFLETLLKDLCSALPREIMVYFQIQSNLVVVTPNNIQKTNSFLELNE